MVSETTELEVIEPGPLALPELEALEASKTVAELWGLNDRIICPSVAAIFLEGASILVRRQSPLHVYAFSIGTVEANKTARAFYVQGNINAKHLVFVPFDWELDTWYNLRLTAEKDRFRFYIDDELVIDYTDSVYPAGKVGIASALIGITSHFDNFSVTGDDIAELNIPVLPKAGLAACFHLNC